MHFLSVLILEQEYAQLKWHPVGIHRLLTGVQKVPVQVLQSGKVVHLSGAALCVVLMDFAVQRPMHPAPSARVEARCSHIPHKCSAVAIVAKDTLLVRRLPRHINMLDAAIRVFPVGIVFFPLGKSFALALNRHGLALPLGWVISSIRRLTQLSLLATW